MQLLLKKKKMRYEKKILNTIKYKSNEAVVQLKETHKHFLQAVN